MRYVKTLQDGSQIEAPKLFKVDGKWTATTPELCLKFGFQPIEDDKYDEDCSQNTSLDESALEDLAVEEDGILYLPQGLTFEQIEQQVRIQTDKATADGSNNVKPILQRPFENRTTADNVALVQCAFGIDEEQLKACEKAIDLLFRHNAFPEEYVFVEAQDDERDARFGYLAEKYGAKYVFRKTGPKNRGVFLKHALWSIGARLAGADKLVFLDADTAFANSDWLQQASRSLDGFDVSQPFQEIFFADELADTEEDKYFSCQLKKSFAYALKTAGDAAPQMYKTGHGLAMTREYFGKIGCIDVLPSNGSDVWFWQKHLDPACVFKASLGLPLMADDYGYDLLKDDVSYARNIAFHVRHGKQNSRKYDDTIYFNKKFCDSVNETLDTSKDLPEFKDDSVSAAHQECVLRCRQSDESARDIFNDVQRKIYRKINGKSKLVFLTCLNMDSGSGLIDSHRIARIHKYLLDKYCVTPHEYWCITNEKIDGIDTIPFELNPSRDIVGWNAQIEMYRNLFPGRPVMTLDFDCVPWRPFEVRDIDAGEFFMMNEVASFREHDPIGMYNGGTTYFKGDMSIIFDEYRRIKRNGMHVQQYFLAIQEIIEYLALHNGIRIQNVQKILDVLLLKLNERKKVPSLHQLQKYDFVHYLGPVKPWNETFFSDNKCIYAQPPEFVKYDFAVRRYV